MTNSKHIVFISCGQQTGEEKQLGEAIQRLVRELTPFEPYYAEYQTTLEGLTKNIFGALNRCVGLIAVMHHRGRVDPPCNLIRASVWVEQEIAIAAFLRGALGRSIEVAAFTQKGIGLEGVRKQLLLNPKEFTDNKEVIGHLRLILPAWKTPEKLMDSGALDVALEYEKEKVTQERHDYQLVVLLTNRGTRPIDDYHIDVEFPTELLKHPEENHHYVRTRCTKTHSFFRVTQYQHGTKIFPGDTLRAMTLRYFVDDEIFSRRSDLFQKTVTATLYSEGTSKVVEKKVSQLQIF